MTNELLAEYIQQGCCIQSLTAFTDCTRRVAIDSVGDTTALITLSVFRTGIDKRSRSLCLLLLFNHYSDILRVP